jgi:hypothetical protein
MVENIQSNNLFKVFKISLANNTNLIKIFEFQTKTKELFPSFIYGFMKKKLFENSGKRNF